jgi:polysaccharide deacetylase family protein (PEP-CTERM system associated)
LGTLVFRAPLHPCRRPARMGRWCFMGPAPYRPGTIPDRNIPEDAVEHAFTVDVEDWFEGIPIAPEARAAAEPRLERGTDVLLGLLDNRSVRGTFFFLGPTARRYPELARRVAGAGHEIGCHGWSHDLIYSMDRESFRRETVHAKEVLEEIVGQAVTAYRAAYFSITRRSLWALEVLAELGFLVDSSVFPVKNWRYGIPDFEPAPHEVPTPAGPIYEFPLPVVDYPGRRMPATGGAYFRIYPYFVSRSHMRRLERAGTPAVFYLHPWELDPDHPRVPFHWRPRLTHYWNLSSTKPKLARLLSDFGFAPLREVMEHGHHRDRSEPLRP